MAPRNCGRVPLSPTQPRQGEWYASFNLRVVGNRYTISVDDATSDENTIPTTPNEAKKQSDENKKPTIPTEFKEPPIEDDTLPFPTKDTTPQRTDPFTLSSPKRPLTPVSTIISPFDKLGEEQLKRLASRHPFWRSLQSRLSKRGTLRNYQTRSDQYRWEWEQHVIEKPFRAQAQKFGLENFERAEGYDVIRKWWERDWASRYPDWTSN